MIQGTATPDRANQKNNCCHFQSGRFEAVISGLTFSFSWSTNSGFVWITVSLSSASGCIARMCISSKSQSLLKDFIQNTVCCFWGTEISSSWEAFWSKWFYKEAFTKTDIFNFQVYNRVWSCSYYVSLLQNYFCFTCCCSVLNRPGSRNPHPSLIPILKFYYYFVFLNDDTLQG